MHAYKPVHAKAENYNETDQSSLLGFLPVDYYDSRDYHAQPQIHTHSVTHTYTSLLSHKERKKIKGLSACSSSASSVNKCMRGRVREKDAERAIHRISANQLKELALHPLA